MSTLFGAMCYAGSLIVKVFYVLVCLFYVLGEG